MAGTQPWAAGVRPADPEPVAVVVVMASGASHRIEVPAQAQLTNMLSSGAWATSTDGRRVNLGMVESYRYVEPEG